MTDIIKYLENNGIDKDGIDKVLDWLADLDIILNHSDLDITKVDIMELIRIKFSK